MADETRKAATPDAHEDATQGDLKDLPSKPTGAVESESVKGGLTADGSLDAGIHFKYDIKAQKGP